MSSVFPRGVGSERAVAASGCWITDSSGDLYLDASGGAVVTGIGHGRREVVAALAEQLMQLDYVHATAFTSDVVEDYCARVAGLVPMQGARVYPVSGGSEATETVLKMALAYQQARGHPERSVLVAREGSYHGNTLGALDLSGRPHLRAPYESWLGRFRQVPLDLGRLADEFVKGDVAAFVAEPISGASLAAAVPPDEFWPAVSELCRRHGVLLVTDEVMTGFGRTGRWFGIQHWDVEPDLMICAKGASSGYWPLGLAIASGPVFDAIGEDFVHGYTYSHHPAGAAVGRAVLDIIANEGLVEAAAEKGERLQSFLKESLAGRVTDVRGKGLLIGVTFDADPRIVVASARRQGLLVYPAAIPAILLGPPLIISNEEIDELVRRLSAAL